MSKPLEPQRGDLVEVVWADIIEDPVGDPVAAKAMRRVSYGIFYERRKAEIRGVASSDIYEIPVVVTTTTLDPDSTAQSGYCCYPADCIVEMRVVRRSKARAT